MQPHYWNDAKTHLSKQCPTMKQLIARYEGESLTARDNGFYTLLRSVVGQQISVKAADAIWAKFSKAVDPMTPENLLRKRESTLRSCGLSGSKVAYVRNVAEFYRGRGVTADAWKDHSDEEVLRELVAIKGIGVWTAEMFLIFHLMRPDVFPVQDIGVLKAVDLHITKEARKAFKEYKAISNRWEPYRTVATWYLWRALDPVPVAY